MHLCGVCFQAFTSHRDSVWPPRCCFGCSCGTTQPDPRAKTKGTSDWKTELVGPEGKLVEGYCCEAIDCDRVVRASEAIRLGWHLDPNDGWFCPDHPSRKPAEA